jgi:flagellar basal body-associated protein FliL
MSSKTTRIIAIIIVAVMVISFLGSMILPYIF